MTKRKNPALFARTQVGSYFSITFKPLTDPCWVRQEEGRPIVGDEAGEPLSGGMVLRLAHQKPMVMLLSSVSVDNAYQFDPDTDAVSDELLYVTANHILSFEEVPTPTVNLEGVEHPMMILPTGAVRVGCHALTVLDVRRVFAALADHFEYDLEGWVEDPEAPPKAKRGRGRR